MAKPPRTITADAAPATGSADALQTSFEVGGVTYLRSRREAQRLAEAQAAGTSEPAAGTDLHGGAAVSSSIPNSEVIHG